MGAFFTAIIEALKAYYYWLYEPLLTLLNYVALFWFEVLLALLYFQIMLIAIPADLIREALNFSGVPAPALYIFTALGIGPAISIIFAAMGVRVLLNLIPAAFTRI